MAENWSCDESARLYGVRRWGAGYFDVNVEGHLTIRPDGPSGSEVDLHDLISALVERGVNTPTLLRFPDMLRHRMDALAGIFNEILDDYSYGGRFRGVFPIKVNQQRHLIEAYVEHARGHHMGLEAGSKPELLVALTLLDDPEALLICNGYKDASYVEAALLSHQLGRQTILVIEKLSEVGTILDAARRLGVRPTLGVRARLSKRGVGRWQRSSGDGAKFGLAPDEIMVLVSRLREAGMLDCLKLLHFHIGSQISAIRVHKDALHEASRLYAELARLGAPMGYFDVGGGLGVDYDGSRTSTSSSLNYTEREYVADLVTAIQSICQREGLQEPDIVTESGRALVAHHAVLAFDILGVKRPPLDVPLPEIGDDAPDLLVELRDLNEQLKEGRAHLQEAWNDALQWRERGLEAFNMGLLSLPLRADLELLFWCAIGHLGRAVATMPDIPREMEGLPRLMASNAYCNLSLFQSLPDVWAIGQLFPIVPLQRLGEKPGERAVLVDLTCDSDGCIDRFVGDPDPVHSLPIHRVAPGERYFLGVPLVGAYQEILGALHNLFGDTHTASVVLDEDGRWQIERVLEGDAVSDVLGYMNYNHKDLIGRLRKVCESSIRAERITPVLAKRLLTTFRDTLKGYTYLER